MSTFARAGTPPTQLRDLSPILKELELFARIEGFVGERAALLAAGREARDQHDLTWAVSAELDRIGGAATRARRAPPRQSRVHRCRWTGLTLRGLERPRR